DFRRAHRVEPDFRAAGDPGHVGPVPLTANGDPGPGVNSPTPAALDRFLVADPPEQPPVRETLRPALLDPVISHLTCKFVRFQPPRNCGRCRGGGNSVALCS